MTTDDANSHDVPDGHLEDGCSPSTPENDSLQRQYVLAHSSRMEAEARAMGGEVIRTEHLVFGARGIPQPIFNQCVLLQPLTSIGHDAFAEELAACRALGSPISIWSLWPTGDLRHLRLTLSGHPPLMARPAGPRAVSATREPDGVRVAEVADDDDLSVFGRVAAAGSGWATPPTSSHRRSTGACSTPVGGLGSRRSTASLSRLPPDAPPTA